MVVKTNSETLVYKYLETLEKEGLYHPILWLEYFRIGNNTEKLAAAKKILEHEDPVTLQPEIIVAAFGQPGNDKEKLAAAKKILLNPNWNESKNLFPVLEALKIYSKFLHTQDFVKERLKQIINMYLGDRKSKVNRDFYFGLMYIPFHQDKLWKAKSEYIISNWNTIYRRGISNVLHSYISYPDSISRVCKSILENWKTEIVKPIHQVYGQPHYGDHIKMALGHIELRHLAKRTASEIIKSKENNSIDVPDYLIKIVEQIINEDIYPEWISDKGNENLLNN